jgi:anti-sigma regulatory factor (Ser/Thr protein kinase)
MTDVVSFSMARNEAALAELSASVDRTLEEHHLPMKATFAVQLAIDEFVSNILKFGSGDRSDNDIAIRLVFEDDRVAVEIEHEGDQFNPLERTNPVLDQSLEERQIGGLGIHLTRNTMDECKYSYRDGRNLMVLRKKFKLDGSS